jgi:hypothetical protein
MNSILRSLAGLTLSAALLLAPAVASANGFNFRFSNHLTGPDSSNRNTVRIDHNVRINITKRANVRNVFDIFANTGGNTQNRNTVAGDIRTGPVNIWFDIVNRVN